MPRNLTDDARGSVPRTDSHACDQGLSVGDTQRAASVMSAALDGEVAGSAEHGHSGFDRCGRRGATGDLSFAITFVGNSAIKDQIESWFPSG